jgi:glycerophosphoryl diester phosphodiesterase
VKVTATYPITFAHRGAPHSRSEENTLAAFKRAIALGATGLETDIGLTADGVPVLVHPTFLRRGPRVSALRRSELPPHVATLDELYARCGNAFHLSLDMAQPSAAEAVVRTAEDHGALDRLWLTYWRLDTLAAWRERWPRLKLVYPTIPLSPGRPRGVVERLTATGVDALNVFHPFCFPGTVRLAHERGLLIFAWGIKRRAAVSRVLERGVDGVFADNVEEMVAATRRTT